MSGSSDDLPHVVALEQLPDLVEEENYCEYPAGTASESPLHLANECLKSARTDPLWVNDAHMATVTCTPAALKLTKINRTTTATRKGGRMH